MTVGRNTEKTMTDQVWSDPCSGAASGDGPWAGLALNAVALDPETPTIAAPGSMEKVMMLQARYAAGVPLWDERDSQDHSESMAAQALRGTAQGKAVEDRVEERGEPLAI
jgi:hypothetical protein